MCNNRGLCDTSTGRSGCVCVTSQCMYVCMYEPVSNYAFQALVIVSVIGRAAMGPDRASRYVLYSMYVCMYVCMYECMYARHK